MQTPEVTEVRGDLADAIRRRSGRHGLVAFHRTVQGDYTVFEVVVDNRRVLTTGGRDDASIQSRLSRWLGRRTY